MLDSYQLIGTYGADADEASQWCGLTPGYTGVSYNTDPGVFGPDGTYNVVTFGGLTEPSGSGIQQLNTASGFGSDLTDMTTLIGNGATSVTGAPEYQWNGTPGNTGGSLNYSLGSIDGVETYTVSQPMSEWGVVENYVLDLDTADAATIGAINVTGFQSTNIAIGSGGTGAVPTIHADQVGQGFFDMSQAGAAVDATILTSQPADFNMGSVIVYNSSSHGGSLVMGVGDATGTCARDGDAYDNTGELQTLDYTQTGAGDTIDITASNCKADISLTDGGSLIGSSAWSAMVSGGNTIASLESEVGAGTGSGALLKLPGNGGGGTDTVTIAGSTGLSVITNFDGATGLDMLIPSGATYTGEQTYTDGTGATAYGYFNSTGGGVVLMGNAADLSKPVAAYAHAGNETNIYFAPA